MDNKQGKGMEIGSGASTATPQANRAGSSSGYPEYDLISVSEAISAP